MTDSMTTPVNPGGYSMAMYIYSYDHDSQTALTSHYLTAHVLIDAVSSSCTNTYIKKMCKHSCWLDFLDSYV